MNKLIVVVLILLLIHLNSNAQEPHRFDEEIKKITELPISSEEDLTIFTGSSSIRFWKDLADDCDGMQVVNTGFGGSHMSDLLYFLDQTVLRFQPSKVYIYEGDNDIASEKKPAEIIKTAKEITAQILAFNPTIKIYFISTKPSPSRWMYKEQYQTFNSLLMDYCNSQDQLFYIDIWNPMLAENGRVKPHIFISDSLHMNREGYLLWKDIICKSS